jgi:hypothetical protein
MGTVYAPPAGFDPPDFDKFIKQPGGFDSDGYDKACAAFVAKLAAEANRRGHTGDLVGEVIYFPVADGQAAYMVWQQKPLHLIHLAFGDGYSISEAEARGLRVADVRAKVNFSRMWSNLGDENDRWWAARKVGEIVHYDNGFKKYVRGEIVTDTDGKHKMRPIALVNAADPNNPRSGGWRKHDLPQWTAWGDITEPHHVEMIIKGELFAPNESCMYESRLADGKVKPGEVDPRKLPALSLTVTPPTPEEAESHRLCRIRNDAMTILQDQQHGHDWKAVIDAAIAKLQEA